MSSNGKRSQVTLKEVADRASVSMGTASRVLNNHPNVQPGLRMRVLNAASELGYPVEKSRANYYTKVEIENAASNTVAPELPNLNIEQNREISRIAFCCRPVISPLMDEAYNPYFSSMLHGVERECRQQNLHLIYRIINDDETAIEEGCQKLLEAGVEALLLINFVSEDLVKGLLNLNLPAVLVDHYFPNLPQLDTVTHENYKGAAHAINYLIKRGHRQIGFVSGLSHYTVLRRFEAYRLTLEQHQIPFNPNYVLRGNLKIDGGIDAAHEIVERNLDCTAYFCANDETAIGLIQGLRSHGIKVPQDVSVIGFDDVDSARLITPTLTTVRGNPAGVGRVAVRKLLERARQPDLPITETALATTLIERESVRNIGD